MLDIDQNVAATVQVMVEQKMAKWKLKLSKAHDVQLKNYKSEALYQSKEFVLFATEDIQKAFTREMQAVI